MKRKVSLFIMVFLLLIFMISALFVNLNKDTDDKDKMVKITLAEVAHTIFYAPQYVAIENGYFEEYGIDVSLILASGVNSENVIHSNYY